MERNARKSSGFCCTGWSWGFSSPRLFPGLVGLAELGALDVGRRDVCSRGEVLKGSGQ